MVVFLYTYSKVGTDDGSKMLGFAFVVACGAKQIQYFIVQISVFAFLTSRDVEHNFFD